MNTLEDDIRDLQRRYEEGLTAEEAGSEVLAEATRRGHDVIDVACSAGDVEE